MMLKTFQKFMADAEASDMYVTGPAGTGKTTGLAECVQMCIDAGIPYIVCAYTHKACGVLRSKLPEGANISTVHAFIKKRPAINQDAKHAKAVTINQKMGEADAVTVCFIDEYSCIGEKDLMDIRLEQEDPDCDEFPRMKVVWLGDPNQLPPVGDQEAVEPYGPYRVRLTKVHRQKADNPLKDTLGELVAFIEGKKKVGPLYPNTSFIRGVDLVKTYKEVEDPVVLAFTNKRVEELNAAIEGKAEPEEGDKLFSPTTKHYYKFISFIPASEVVCIDRAFGEPLTIGSKYKTLEHIVLNQDVQFARVHDLELDETKTVAFMFGHFTFKTYLEQLKHDAASTNNAIESKYKIKATEWSKQNRDNVLSRNRARAWRNFLAFNECVICLDFAHAMTVHKSQGSTFNNVLVDTQDIGLCADRNFSLYLRLMYVALSRAANKVYASQ